MLDDGLVFKSQTVDTWLDCGNKDIIIKTASYVLKHFDVQSNMSAKVNNSLLIQPVYLGEDVVIDNCVLGPNVSIEYGSKLTNVVAKDTIVYSNSVLSNVVIEN